MNNVRIEKTSDLNETKEILSINNLPSQDIESSNVQMFSALLDSKLIGIIGFENNNNIALLRSFVVLEQYRNKKYGQVICKKFIEMLQEKGFKEIYLLTTTAKEFFEKLGFLSIDRNDAPIEIQNSSEFSSLCPATAQCLKIKF